MVKFHYFVIHYKLCFILSTNHIGEHKTNTLCVLGPLLTNTTHAQFDTHQYSMRAWSTIQQHYVCLVRHSSALSMCSVHYSPILCVLGPLLTSTTCARFNTHQHSMCARSTTHQYYAHSIQYSLAIYACSI